jgi:hypothetical protein
MVSYFYRIVEFTRRAKPIPIICDPNNQRPDKQSYSVWFYKYISLITEATTAATTSCHKYTQHADFRRDKAMQHNTKCIQFYKMYAISVSYYLMT